MGCLLHKYSPLVPGCLENPFSRGECHDLPLSLSRSRSLPLCLGKDPDLGVCGVFGDLDLLPPPSRDRNLDRDRLLDPLVLVLDYLLSDDFDHAE